MKSESTPGAIPVRWVGRTFLHPAVDYLLVGGGLSLIFCAVMLFYPQMPKDPGAPYFMTLMVFFVLAHFAASTLRLYARPGAFSIFPVPTMLFPLLFGGILMVCMAWPDPLGGFLQRLYLTWSPYHYAAQAYGLAVMYSYRSGCQLSHLDKRLLRWSALATFFWTFLHSPDVGAAWLIPNVWIREIPAISFVIGNLARISAVVAVVAPFLIYLKTWRSASGPMPLIALMLLVSNVAWWALLGISLQAFAWATVFHGIQYLVIVTVFHVRDQMAQPDNRHGQWYHGLWFYGLCIAMGYVLFRILPSGFEVLGFGHVEAMLLVAAVVNLHHFVVDGYIWRFGKSDANRKIIESSAAAT